MSEFSLNAESREDQGKGASRRLRRLAELVPAVVYGGTKKPKSISIAHKEIVKAIENESFFSSILELNIDGKAEKVIIKDLQRHPAKSQVMHADFLRISAKKPIRVKVPLHFINETSCVGVKMGGGKILHKLAITEISCLPDKLPEYLTVDMLEVGVGEGVHLSDIKAPDGVEIVALRYGKEHDQAIASVDKPKGG